LDAETGEIFIPVLDDQVPVAEFDVDLFAAAAIGRIAERASASQDVAR
jgi:hypothetical protein